MFCTTVPYFGTTVSFLHYCFVFSQQNKNGTVYFVPLFRDFVPLFRFCTTVPFFARLFRTIEQKRNSVFWTTVPCFCTYVPFFNHCSVFPQRNKNGTVCLRITVPFFLHFCSVFPQQNKNGSVYFVPLFHVFIPLFRFCTTVPFCAILFRFSTMEQKRNSVFWTTFSVFLYHCYVFPLLFRFSSTKQKRNSVFSYHCSVFALLFRFPITEQKRTSVFCTTVQCFRTTVPVFALLFRFSTTEQKRNSVFCTTVPCFCITVPFLHHCSVFCTTVPFFFALLFRFSTKEQKI